MAKTVRCAICKKPYDGRGTTEIDGEQRPVHEACYLRGATKPNTFAADLAVQTEHDDPTMIVVDRKDAEELIKVVRDFISHDDDMREKYGSCEHCGCEHEGAHDFKCLRVRAESLLARMGKEQLYD